MQVNFNLIESKKEINLFSLFFVILFFSFLNAEKSVKTEINYKFMNDFKHSEEPYYKFHPLSILEIKLSYRKVYLTASVGKGYWENMQDEQFNFYSCDVFPISTGLSGKFTKNFFVSEAQLNLKDYVIKYDNIPGRESFTESEFSVGYEISAGITYKKIIVSAFYAYDKIFSSKPMKINYWGIKTGFILNTPFLGFMTNEK
ncbi:MAG: hypothetical protein CSB55_03315 [Candidatus Cloacimonadota bacterium]|nr:MAG: hypothetical protein CSB55_03315 [Candidatus Cloacimonadota bacterium]